MTKINRRKFISVMGSVSLGVAAFNIESAALELTVNSFEVDESIYLEDVDTILVSVKEMNIYSKNIDDSNDAILKVFGSIEDNDIGKLDERNIDVTGNTTTTVGPYKFDVKEGSKFKSEYLTLDPYIDQNSIEINVDFKLEHPSIEETVTETSQFTIEFADGEFLSHSDGLTASSFDLSTEGENYKEIDASDLSIWSIDDRFEQLKILLGGGTPINKSSYIFPKGVLDVVNLEYQVSPRNSPEIDLSDPDKSKYDIS